MNKRTTETTRLQTQPASSYDPSVYPEYFSVAPMMAHTNRHHRYMFRFLSQKTPLYTEMVPSNQIVAAYNLAMEKSIPNTSSSSMHDVEACYVNSMHGLRKNRFSFLSQLLRIFSQETSLAETPCYGPIILQVGGRDEKTLAQATAIAAAYGYNGVNLNCGCPSSAVSGGARSGGAALMREPTHVAKCVEAMSLAAQVVRNAGGPILELSVKHRIGVRDAGQYRQEDDLKLPDEVEAYPSCRDFIRTITMGSAVSKVHVHVRLALLDFNTNVEEGSLWVPGREAPATNPSGKVDYKRQQYKAKQRARRDTILNRSIPPLRPNVVDMVADEFPDLQVISNGGIQSMDEIIDRTVGSNVVGAMVGRAAINHPCAFSRVDELWTTENNDGEGRVAPTRGSILTQYIDYCRHEEASFRSQMNPNAFIELRKKLVAAPFHLLAGEEGGSAYQRRIRKLVSRVGRHSAASTLTGAMAAVPSETLEKPVTEYTQVDDLATYSEAAQRSGPLQRQIF